MHKGFMRSLLTISIISSVASGIVFGNGINSKADNIFNHPSTKWGHFKDFAYYDVNTDNVMNLLELGGYHKLTKSFTEYCHYYNRELDKGWHVSPANNQNNHKKQWGTENPRRTVILANSLSEANIYDAAKNNRTYATEDYDFKLKYTTSQKSRVP